MKVTGTSNELIAYSYFVAYFAYIIFGISVVVQNAFEVADDCLAHGEVGTLEEGVRLAVEKTYLAFDPLFPEIFMTGRGIQQAAQYILVLYPFDFDLLPPVLWVNFQQVKDQHPQILQQFSFIKLALTFIPVVDEFDALCNHF